MSNRKRAYASIVWMLGVIGAGMAMLYAAVTHA